MLDDEFHCSSIGFYRAERLLGCDVCVEAVNNIALRILSAPTRRHAQIVASS